MTRDIKYWLTIVILNFIPIFIIQKTLGLFWSSNYETNTKLAILNLLLTIVVVPFVLIVINYNIAKKYSQRYFIINGFLICCAVTLCAHLGFINWADSVGDYYNPDQETVGVVSFEKIAGIVLTVIGTTIGQLSINEKKNTST
jgi:hypothetical protein